MNVVPDFRTIRIANALIARTPYEGVEATVSAVKHLPDDQLPALIFALARAASNRAHVTVGVELPQRITDHGGRAPVRAPNEFTIAQRREAHRRFRGGDRTPVVIAGEREYQRNRRTPEPTYRRVDAE